MSAIRKLRRQQERKAGSNPLKVIEGLSSLNGLTELAPKINEFIKAAKSMEGLIEDLEGAEGLLERVTYINDTFESLVRRQNRSEEVLKEVLRLLYQGDDAIDSKLKKLEGSLGDHVE